MWLIVMLAGGAASLQRQGYGARPPVGLVGGDNVLAEMDLLVQGSLLALLQRHGGADTVSALLRVRAVRSQALVARPDGESK